MPTYEYECQHCAHRLEVQQSIIDSPLEQCPHCSTLSLKRGVGGGVGVQFRGKGFYKTDYSSPSSCHVHSSSCGCHPQS